MFIGRFNPIMSYIVPKEVGLVIKCGATTWDHFRLKTKWIGQQILLICIVLQKGYKVER